MLPMLRDLVSHKWHANAALFKAIRQNEKAAQDEELRKLLHHILLANRFWLMLSLGQQFDFEKDRHVGDSLDLLTTHYRETQAQELKWVAQMQEVETPLLRGSTFSVAEGIMQICLHSHGHRAQCATRLRQLGGTPPATDFIMWLKEKRPAPEW